MARVRRTGRAYELRDTPNTGLLPGRGYVGHILNSTPITNLPVVQMTPELIINLKTANKSNIVPLPDGLLGAANELIEAP